MPKKKVKYPAKFRQTLEKVAAGREGRESAPRPARNPFFETLYHSSLLPAQSVHFMHSRLEETPFGMRLLTAFTLLEETGVHDLVSARPPWEEP
jgi:hypothetical protein